MENSRSRRQLLRRGNEGQQEPNVFSWLDREALHKAVYNCSLCRDHGYNVQRVQPEWDPSKAHKPMHRWGMLIGQSPGIGELERAKQVEKHETTQGTRIAFAGDAGRRLRKEWLSEMAHFTDQETDRQFFKTSVTKCFPGRDERNRDRKPTMREIQLCSRYLKEEIRLVNPSVLIPIGEVAIHWFFPNTQLKDVIGKKLQWRGDGAEYTIVCLPHPSSASAWWKAKDNRQLLRRALRILSELRAGLPR